MSFRSCTVNVPAPPPPPQMGLLGAITGYEAQRSREGGVGAALTERDRERREAVRLPYPAGISISPEADRASHSGCPGRAGAQGRQLAAIADGADIAARLQRRLPVRSAAAARDDAGDDALGHGLGHAAGHEPVRRLRRPDGPAGADDGATGGTDGVSDFPRSQERSDADPPYLALPILYCRPISRR
jgi:hypothetical protein